MIEFLNKPVVEYYEKKKDVDDIEDNVIETPNYTPSLPILPWESTRTIIQRLIDSKSLLLAESSSLHATIPYGFQSNRILQHPRSVLKRVVYIPQTTNAELFIALDRQYIHIWRGTTRIKKILTTGVNVDVNNTSNELIREGVEGISDCVYCEKYKLFIVASTKLELRLLDSNFAKIYVTSSLKPVLTYSVCLKTQLFFRMAFVSELEEIITGQVGCITIWKLVVKSQNEFKIVQDRSIILSDEDWVNYLIYDKSLNRIIAAIDCSIHIFDYSSGKKISMHKNVHEMELTAIVYYEPYEYIISASKDGLVKVWNSQNCVVWIFKGQYSPITGLELVEKICHATQRTIPIVLCSSINGTIKLFNFETGKCVYRMDTQHECLGLSYMKKDTFYQFSKKSIQVWHLNRYQSTFSFLRSQPTILERITFQDTPAKILAVTSDGSIKFISPVTGAYLVSGFPMHKDVTVLCSVYDIVNEKIYSLTSNGDICLYDCKTNPCKITGIWEYTGRYEKVECIVGVMIPLTKKIGSARTFASKFFLFSGNLNGQIEFFNLTNGDQETLVQAHIAPISKLVYEDKSKCLVSLGKDLTIKFWKVAYVDSSCGTNLPKKDKLKHQTEKNNFGLSLELSSTINLSLFSTQPKAFAFDPYKKMIGIANGNTLFTCSYDQNCTPIAPPSKEREKVTPDRITSICYLLSSDIWASASTDGTVKIWDIECVIIREIQFNEPIYSMCFCNEPGDLLVGLSDEISLVRLQDYFPTNLLTACYKRKFVDDIIETPLMFDSQLDFWEFVYDIEVKKYGHADGWHSSKNNKQKKLIDMDKYQLKRERKSDVVMKRKHRRVFLTTEHENFLKTLKRKNNNKQNTIKSAGGGLPKLSESAENTDDDNDLLNLRHNGFNYSDPMLLPLGVEIYSPNESLYGLSDSEGSIFGKAGDDFDFEKSLNVLSEMKSSKTKKKKQEEKETYKNDHRRKFSTSLEAPRRVPQKKQKIINRKYMILPNSSIVGHELYLGKNFKKKQPQSRKDGKENPNEPDKSNLPVSPEDSAVARESSLQRTIRNAKEKIRLKKKQITEAEEAQLEKEKLFALYEKNEMNTLLVSVESLVEVNLEYVGKEQVLDTPIIRTERDLEYNENKSDDDDDNDNENKINEENSGTKSSSSLEEITNLADSDVKQLIKSRRSSTTKKEEKTILPKVLNLPLELDRSERILSNSGQKHHLTTLKPSRSNYMSSQHIISNTQETTRSYHVLDFNVAEKEEMDEEVQFIDPITDVNFKVASEYVWKLIKGRRGSFLCESIKRLSEKKIIAGFPSQDGVQITIPLMVHVVNLMLFNGNEEEKIDAIKASLFLFHVFQRDFRDPMTTFIEQQIQLLQDKSWKVRAQICASILGYGIYSPEIVLALICRLADKNEVVRNIALSSLMYFGISTRKSLFNAMTMVGLINPLKIGPQMQLRRKQSFLDRLITKMRFDLQEETRAKIEKVKNWLFEKDLPPSTKVNLERGNSCPEHLAGIFFPPDAKHEDFKGLYKDKFKEKFEIRRTRGISPRRPTTGLENNKWWSNNQDFETPYIRKIGRRESDVRLSAAMPSSFHGKDTSGDAVLDRLLHSPYYQKNSEGRKQAVLLSAVSKSVRPLTAGHINSMSISRPTSAYVADGLITRMNSGKKVKK